ncbi:PepSY domain-containing protein [Thiothrix lacustris]|uniref:PepSY domain-containing protein n=1 Tax=Thiothrix lacustris TaxID=525917 RepID=UPI0027E54E05|nr:PepSY domain-containing protein [Thiothrix lacustris]WMP18778.1 PepSY domain-containing protein [Thiothrix lacustris]
MKLATKLAVVLLATGVLGTTYVAQATEKDGANDAAGVTKAAISLTDAVSAALKQVPGTASRAEFETDDATNQALWQIEIVSDKGVMDVEVDATSGQVTKQVADKMDEDKAGDENGMEDGKEKVSAEKNEAK